jgi:hypothetical protein
MRRTERLGVAQVKGVQCAVAAGSRGYLISLFQGGRRGRQRSQWGGLRADGAAALAAESPPEAGAARRLKSPRRTRSLVIKKNATLPPDADARSRILMECGGRARHERRHRFRRCSNLPFIPHLPPLRKRCRRSRTALRALCHRTPKRRAARTSCSHFRSRIFSTPHATCPPKGLPTQDASRKIPPLRLDAAT